jgi:hypothetical protein
MSDLPDIHEIALKLFVQYEDIDPIDAYECAANFIAERTRRMEAERQEWVANDEWTVEGNRLVPAPAPVPVPDADGWFPHDGGPCPECMKGKRVDVIFRDGGAQFDWVPPREMWPDAPGDSDITFFRPTSAY